MATPRNERRLAAILAADIVGYSRLIEQDEAATLAAIRDLRGRVVDPLLAEHRGRIVKLMGDGAIVEFGSVVDAVACAVAVQKAVAEGQAQSPPDRRIVFRMGVNLGDVVVEGDDLLGDGVNVAARLEQLCDPGGVLISGTAFDHLQGKLGLPLEFTGAQRVKNMDRPVRAYRVRLDGRVRRFRLPRLGRGALGAVVALCLLLLAAAVGWRWWQPGPPDYVARPVVAVLPFTTPAGADPRLTALADRVAVGVVDQLSASRLWSVLGRGATLPYRDRPNAARALGLEQGAAFVVEGSLQQSGERLRASAQLIDAATGEQIWSDRFDGATDDWTAAQDELGSRVGHAIYEDGLRKIIGNRASGRSLDDLAAYELVQLASEQMGRATREANAEGLALVDLALARDPRSSAALLWRARGYREQVDQGYAPADEAMARWGDAARALVDLDPTYPWGHEVLATWYSYSGKQVALVQAEYDRAVELAPKNPDILAQVAENLPYLGQPRHADELLQRAARLDPEMHFDWRQYQVGFFLHRFREAADLIEDFTKPTRWDYLFATLSYAQLGDTAAAARWRDRLIASWPDYSFELTVSPSGDFYPEARAERTLWLESLAKAGLPKCATAEQVARLKLKPVPECEAERRRAEASRM